MHCADRLPKCQQPHHTDNATTAQLSEFEFKQLLTEQLILQQPVIEQFIFQQPVFEQRVIKQSVLKQPEFG